MPVSSFCCESSCESSNSSNGLFIKYEGRDEVEDLFTSYGRITRCDVKRGFAFVEFEDRKDAEVQIFFLCAFIILFLKKKTLSFMPQDALRVDGSKLNGTRIAVEWAKGEGRSGSDECFKCHRTGHWARDCPDAHERRRG